ncbi:MAG TPA: cobalamin-dependent protein [Candidatus Acidoferrales bacterium]|nr:cobalamin-dependent protein [Candidatus Acidoferrales bacterium]
MPLDRWRKGYLEALLKGNHQTAAEVIDRAAASGMVLSDFYLEIFSPALKRIGDLWSKGKINVAQEKLATQITLGEMEKLRAMQRITRRETHRVLVACVEGEQHWVGARMAADLFSMEGWVVDFLGPDVPTSTLVKMINDRRPHLLALSVTMKRGMTQALRVMKQVARLTSRPKILLGGGAITQSKLPRGKDASWMVASDALNGVKLAHQALRAANTFAVLHETLEEMGRRIKELRTRAGWTQQQLAKVTHLARAYIVSVEGGKQNVSIDVLLRIANALRVPPEGLLSGKEFYLATSSGSSR